jgi:large conductance mechanosensitive channel
MMTEFEEFLKEYKVTGLAIAFIIGVAATALVQSLVNNIVMPLITPFIPHGGWETFKLALGPFDFGIGAFFGAIINFAVIALVVFLMAKFILKEEKVSKK